MEDLPSSHTQALFLNSPPPAEGQLLEDSSLPARLMQLRYRLLFPQSLSTLDTNISKRPFEVPKTKGPKKMKLEHNVIVNSLSAPVQQALSRFREASESELNRLKEEGYDTPSSISKLVDKMKTIGGDDKSGITKNYSREDLALVMELSGFNEEGAIRALVLRDELSKLRKDGFNHPEAIDELSLRMKRLVGTKRRPSLPITLSPTSNKITKRLKKAKSMDPSVGDTNSLLASSLLHQRFSFEELQRIASTAPIVTPSSLRKRLYGDGGEDFLAKRQRLLDALDYEASQLEHGHDGDNEVSVRDDIHTAYSSNDESDIDREGGFMISDPLFSAEYAHDDDDDDDDDDDHRFIETDPFSTVVGDLHTSDEERGGSRSNEESGAESDSVEDNTDTHQPIANEVQVWQYNPLLRTKKSIRDSRNNRTLF